MCAAFLDRPNWHITTGGGSNDGPIRAVQGYSYFVPRNTTKLTTRGGTSPDCVEMTLSSGRGTVHTVWGRVNSFQGGLHKFLERRLP